MTFLSATSDVLYRPAATQAAVPRARAALLTQGAALVLFMAAVTVPVAVVEAKWTKLGLIFSIVQQRCLASVSVG